MELLRDRGTTRVIANCFIKIARFLLNRKGDTVDRLRDLLLREIARLNGVPKAIVSDWDLRLCIGLFSLVISFADAIARLRKQGMW